MSDCGGCCDHDGPAPADRRGVWLMAGAGVAIGLGALAGAFGSRPALIGCSLGAIALAVPDPARRAWRALGARVLDINVLMVMAVAGAMALGDWLEAATVVWLFGIAQVVESWSLARARRSIRSLLASEPMRALVRRDGDERELPAEDIRPGDVVIVRPGGRLPVDGHILTGQSSIDQSPITGESSPIAKGPGDEVYAGSINGNAAIELHADRAASTSTMARIIHMVEEAQARRAPVQTYVERFARRYTPAVAVLALVVAVVPPLVLGDGSAQAFGVWAYRALALLVVACPCALVISTPVAVVSALAAGAKRGVLIKGGAYLERLGSIRCVAFDKTGTLTEGRVTVTDVVGVGAATSRKVLSIAAALESRSEHPIGRAIMHRARGEGVAASPGEGFRVLPGRGAEARVGASAAIIGSHRLFEERALCTPSLHARIEEVTARGGSAVLVGHAGAAVGVIGVTDDIRGGGAEAIARLRRQGVGRVVLLTGDDRPKAEAMARAAGLDEAHAELLPDDKVRFIARLRELHGPVAMVGDGINDAPALAAADVGIAMGGVGSDAAIETADVTLMSDDLSALPYVIALGRRAMRNIRANVAIALGLKLAFIVLAASGMATLWMAILADTGASLLVTANGLRLLRAR